MNFNNIIHTLVMKNEIFIVNLEKIISISIDKCGPYIHIRLDSAYVRTFDIDQCKEFLFHYYAYNGCNVPDEILKYFEDRE